jgi:two-component system, NarL family, nitrate/nitrite response regulator NarL
VTLGVLIVDDSLTFLDTACDLLERQGVRVVGLATTSAEALRQAAEFHPEVMLIDITLVGESGFELARRLADQSQGEAVVILISTHSQDDFAELIAESPAAGFLPKSELSADAIRHIATGAQPSLLAACRACRILQAGTQRKGQ